MSLSTLSTALTVGKSAWKKFSDFRDEKAREAYTALEDAAKNVDNATQDWFPESRKQAGFVTQAAHSRLERALEDLNSRRQDVTAAAVSKAEELSSDSKKAAKKNRKKLNKKASKAAQRAEKKVAKATGKKRGCFSKFFLFALVSAIIGAVFYALRGKDAPSTKPPRVEEHSGDADKAAASTLVYSSTTDSAAGSAGEPEKKGSDLVEEGVKERDEELLGSIDAQLAELDAESEEPAEESTEESAEEPAEETGASAEEAAEEIAADPADAAEAEGDERGEEADKATAATAGAAANADTSRVTDDHENEGKHRLASNGPTPNLMPETLAETVEPEDSNDSK
ncbi:hypothetical protein [Corynebacterium endometrii]|uniref:Uncharacterized protein n=1 Tax=Corynebacterium endometrii TaxID=2488819 RepID=A0A4P7QDA4_9CORY|nr:hypothetical protein [Corynebacterium endometrii]QCB27339.1 hypothetical protein CENDO_00140 [Corynebacterium endometrii]